MRVFHSLLILAIIAFAASIRVDKSNTPVEDASYNWSDATSALEKAIVNGAFPGCVALVGNAKGIIYFNAFGNFTYGVPPPENNGVNPKMELDTLFDMASCTKVSATTSAVALMYQHGYLPLETKVVDILGQTFAQNGKKDITVLNLLLHNSGFPPDPNPFYSIPSFGCPESQKLHPEENFSCQKKIYESMMAQTLMNPIGAKYVYSDLNFLVLMEVVGTLAKKHKFIHPSEVNHECLHAFDPESPATAQCYYEAYVRKFVFEPLSMKSTGFLPPKAVWPQCAPAENDTLYLHRVIQGQVSDGNAYALGGIAGHAGLFSNAYDLHLLMQRIMFAPPKDSVFINATTAKYFTTEYNHTQSSRAIGWNTNDPTVFDYGWGLTCGSLSPKTWMHLGYTGTQLCGDPERKVYTILLTNRVYPTSDNMKIEQVRRDFNSAVQRAVDAGKI